MPTLNGLLGRLGLARSEDTGTVGSIARLQALPGIANGRYRVTIDTDGAWVAFPSGVELLYEPAFNSVTDIALTRGDFETSDLALFADRLGPAATVLDIGANVGLYSLTAARSGAVVHAFEPVPATFASLRRNVARADGSVTTVNAAVGASEGSVHITADYHSSNYITTADSSEVTVEVPCVTVDSYCEGFARLDFIKIDVEGRELDVLRGARETLRRLRPALLVEIMERPGDFHDRIAQPAQETLDLMGEAGYDWSVIGEDGQLIAARDFVPDRAAMSYHNYVFTPVDADAR